MEAAGDDLLHGAVELPTLHLSSSKVVYECAALPCVRLRLPHVVEQQQRLPVV